MFIVDIKINTKELDRKLYLGSKGFNIKLVV